MKKLLVLSLILLGSNYAIAGDGGYSQYTCNSSSGRTSLIYYEDNYSQALKPYRLMYVIEGELFIIAPEYKLENFARVPSGHIKAQSSYELEKRETTLTFYDKNQIQVKLTFSGNNIVMHKGAYDPRDEKLDLPEIHLACRVRHEGP